MKRKKLKYYYFKYILRPIRTLRLSLQYLYDRFILALALRGIKLPNLEKIKKKLPYQALNSFERQILIYEIKGERFSFRKGPLWLRKALEKIIFLFEKNKFWFLIFFKTLLALLIIIIPIALFVLIRGVLPVPERVAYGNISLNLPSRSFLRTDWLYTEGPFFSETGTSNYNMVDPKHARGINITPVLEPNAPSGLTHFGIGHYPSKLNMIRGFLVSESSSLSIKKQKSVSVEIEDTNRLRIQYYLFPSKDSNEHQCKIELKDENNKLIASTEQTTPDRRSLQNESGFKKAWHELFTPILHSDSNNIKEFIIKLKTPPKKINAYVKLMDNNEKKEASLKPSSSQFISSFKNYYPNGNLNDLTDDECIFALGDFSFERAVVNPPKRRGIIFILVDTLRVDTAYDKFIMPNLHQFAEEKSIQFLEHRAQGNMTVPSVASLMTSRFAREIGSTAFVYAADSLTKKNFYDTQMPLLATTIQNLGYRVGGIGWLSLFSEAMEGGIDLGFHNAIVSENPAYEARQITEHMGSWLETYGEAPFFLYLHYNTMHGPYKPPFLNIDFSKFLAKPFGLNQRKQLYEALGRYWDSELLNIIQKLKDLGIYDDVDIIITADHGAQFNNQPWEYLAGVDEGITGGYSDKGHTLLDEEIRVPLLIHLSNSPSTNGSIIPFPTAHIDLLPTIYNLAGGLSPNLNWKGINLYPAFLTSENKTSIESILQERNYIYFDAHKYAGILYWGQQFKNYPIKYIRQFEEDDAKLYLTHNPWHLNIRWYQPEIFSHVNLANHTEQWLPSLSGKDLREVRKAYFTHSPSDKILRIIPKFSGEFSASVSFSIKNKKNPKIEFNPVNLKISEIKYPDKITFNIKGSVQKDEPLWINLGASKLNKISFSSDITPLICQNGNIADEKLIPSIFENNICSTFIPPDGIIEGNYNSDQKVVLIQKGLVTDRVQQIEGKGAGEALQKALREWGYAK